MQISDPRNTNIIRHNRWDELAKQSEVQIPHGQGSVDGAGAWNESYLPYHGRPHRHAETVSMMHGRKRFTMRSQQRS
jgi:hypothetical protein